MVAAAWTTMALTPKGHGFPCLIVSGPQGAGKSTFAKEIVGIVDPRGNPLQKFPKNLDDLWLAAAQRRVMVLDNIRRINVDRSDDLSRMLTGGSMEKRRHHSNGQLYVTDAQNPIMLVGIGAVADEPDLLDRGVGVRLRRTGNWLSDAAASKRYEALRAETLGCLFEGVRLWLKARRDGTLLTEGLPRMTTFGQVAHASATAFGFDPDAVLRAMEGSLAEVEAEAMERYPAALEVGAAVLSRSPDFAKLRTDPSDPYTVEAKPEVLFAKLDKLFYGQSRSGLPRTPGDLSKHLFHCERPLANMGITLERRFKGHDRRIVIRVEDWAKDRALISAGSPSAASAPKEEDV